MGPTLLAGIVVGAAAAAVSAVIVRWMRRLASGRGWLDYPTARSSHAAPMPVGGGVGFVAVSMGALLGAAAAGGERAVFLAALGAGAGVAAVGWIDDRRGLGIGPRIAVHAAAGVLVAWIAVATGAAAGLPPGLAVGWWLFWTVSAINVVNFMDGIDGLVGLTAAVYAGFAVAALAGEDTPWLWCAVVLLGGIAGFLRYNWPPAVIFMGDVGSGALGVLLVLLGVATVALREWSPVHAFLPLAPIFLDESMTMVRRLSRGERLWEAHRTHVYQRLVEAGWSHARVALLYAGLALPGALIALALPRGGPPFVLTTLTFVLACGVLLLILGHRSDWRTSAGQPQ